MANASRSVLLAVALLAGCASNAPVDDAAPREVALVCFDRPCGLIIAEGNYREPTVAVDPSDPLRALVASPTERGLDAFLTTGGGVTWRPVGLSLPQGAAGVDDASAVFLADGTILLVAVVWMDPSPTTLPPGATLRGAGVALWRSTDRGENFGGPTILHRSQGVQYALNATATQRGLLGEMVDKTIVVADAETGAAHVFFSRVQEDPRGRSSDILSLNSKDAGATWSEPMIALPGGYGPSAAALGGRILLTGLVSEYELHASDDGGATWRKRSGWGPLQGGSLRWEPMPVALWRANSTNSAALARVGSPDGGLVEIFLSRDAGATWGQPRQVFEDARTQRRNLALAVDARDGRGVLAAFQGDPGEHDGFEAFAQPLLDGAPLDDRKLNEVAHDGELHDRMGVAAAGSRAYVSWMDAGVDAQPLLVANLTWRG